MTRQGPQAFVKPRAFKPHFRAPRIPLFETRGHIAWFFKGPGMIQETKSGLRARLEAEGRWGQFVRRREEFKRLDGLAPAEAWARAAAEFAPIGAMDAPIPTSPLPALPPTRPAPATPPAVPAPPTALDERATLSGLAVAAKARKAPESEWVRWVARNFLMPVGELDPEEVPDPGAPGMLLWARMDPERFYTQVWPRLMPTKQQLDAEARFADDGRSIQSLLAQFERSLCVEPGGAAGDAGAEPDADT